MKLLIEIPDYVYEHALEHSEDSNDKTKVIRSIEVGKPITDGGICDVCKRQEMGTIAVCFHCMAELMGV